jgi:HSP20 family protein
MFSIIRRRPLHEMLSMRDAINRWSDLAEWDMPLTRGLPVDVVETDDEYVVKASLPGINPDDIEITYDQNILTIKGEVKSEDESEDGRYHVRERRYGSFCRNLRLPAAIDAEQIDASYENGVLKLKLPKSEEAKPKRIEVKSTVPVIEGKVKNGKGR